MKKFSAIICLLIAAAAALAQSPSDKSAKVDALMAQWSLPYSPGAAVMVISNNEILHKKGYGQADLETHTPIGANTVFNIASVSKQFTAMAVMILAERGKLSYTDTLEKYFPELPEYTRQITLRHLLNHTSGLADYTIYWDKGPLVNKTGAVYTADDIVKFLARQKKPDFAPGEKWRYSNSGYVLLARIVSKVSGQSFAQFVKENIFLPLGMNESFVYDEIKPQPPNRAVGYIQNGSAFKKADHNFNNFIAGDGELYSTAADLYKWDQALYTEKLVKNATLKEAFTSGVLNDGTKFNYGFGWGLGKYFNMPFVSHSGGTDGFVAHILRFPDQRFTVIVLSNFEQLTPTYSLANKIADIYLADKVRVAPFVTAPVNLNEYAGTYEFFIMTVKVVVENDSLWMISQKNKKTRLFQSGKDEFMPEDNYEMIYGFARNAKGAVTGLSLLSVNGLFLMKQPN